MSSVPPVNYVVRRTGRLVMARVFGLRLPPDVEEYTQALGVEFLRVPSSVRPILCADHRPVAIYAQPVADRLAQAFLQVNSRLERIAIVVAPTNATLTMQLQRLVREASFAGRRVVFSADDAHAHLAAVLSLEELSAMRDFLDEYGVTGQPTSQRLRLRDH